jgi:hypothetical protein
LDNDDRAAQTYDWSMRKFTSKAYLIRHIVEKHTSKQINPADFAMLKCLHATTQVKDAAARNDIIPFYTNPSLPDAKHTTKFVSETSKKAHMKAKLHNPDACAICILKKANTSTHFSLDHCPYCTKYGHSE